MKPQTLDERAALCYFSRFDTCSDTASVSVLCKVEGTEFHACARHWSEWTRSAVNDSLLSAHCPRCAPAYIARRESQASNTAVTVADEPITGPLADAIDNAMHAEGVLAPERARILRRLAANTDAYVAAVMSRQNGAIE
jgi:hypothetical protein